MLGFLFGTRAADAERIAALEDELASGRALVAEASAALVQEQGKTRGLEAVLRKVAGNLCPGKGDPKDILLAAADAASRLAAAERREAMYSRRHKAVCDELDAYKARLRPLLERADPASDGDPVPVERVGVIFTEMKQERDAARRENDALRKQCDAAKAEARRADDYRERVAEELAGLRRQVATLEADVGAAVALADEERGRTAAAESRAMSLWLAVSGALQTNPPTEEAAKSVPPTPPADTAIPPWAGVVATAGGEISTAHKPSVVSFGVDSLWEVDDDVE